MTAGLGYVVLAAMIFERWRPHGGLLSRRRSGSRARHSDLAVLNVLINSNFLAMAP